MGLKDTIDTIVRRLGDGGAAFQRARARHASLAAFATAEDLNRALERPIPGALAEREAIAGALLAEHRAAPCALSHGLLLKSYAPMLRRLARAAKALGEDEAAHAVLAAFLGALGTANTPAELRRATECAVARARRSAQRHGEAVAFDEETHSASRVADAAENADNRATFATLLAQRGESATTTDLLLATVVGGESLGEYVARTHPTLDAAARRRVYLKLQRRRHRALAGLRVGLDAPPAARRAA